MHAGASVMVLDDGRFGEKQMKVKYFNIAKFELNQRIFSITVCY